MRRDRALAHPEAARRAAEHDKRDAADLARLWCAGELTPVRIPGEAEERVRDVVAHAWKAQQRLHQRYQHLAYRKLPQVAVVAVARELVGFLWAVMRDLPTPEVSAA